MSSMKNHQRTLHFIPWSLHLFIRVPFQLHGAMLFRRIELIVHMAISVLQGTHLQSREA